MVKSLVEELQALIQSEANNYPPPQRCSVTHVYDDKHVDVKTNNDVLVYVELLGADVEKGDSCLLVFLNDEYNDYVAISSNGSDASVTVDSALSSSSTNPVQNKVINSALDGKASSTDLTNGYVQKSNGANTMTDSSAYSTIGTSANATQKQINAKIDEKLDDIYDTFLCENLLFDESEYVG